MAQSKAVVHKATCPNCGQGGKFGWRIIQVTMGLLGGGGATYFVWECIKCSTTLLHWPFGIPK